MTIKVSRFQFCFRLGPIISWIRNIKTKFMLKMHGNRPPGREILKKIVRNVLTCADFSEISAQKLYIIMR